MRATDKIHRDIEEYLAVHGLFYDRRKNYYKNQGKPVRKIVSIAFIAQSVLACAFRDPANARARPSSLIKKDEDYNRIFNERYPLDVYYKSAEITIRVEVILRNDMSIPRSHWNNIRFYASMLVVIRLIGSQNLSILSVHSVADIDLTQVTDDIISRTINDVWVLYQDLGGTDQVAKGTDLKSRILEEEKK